MPQFLDATHFGLFLGLVFYATLLFLRTFSLLSFFQVIFQLFSVVALSWKYSKCHFGYVFFFFLVFPLHFVCDLVVFLSSTVLRDFLGILRSYICTLVVY